MNQVALKKTIHAMPFLLGASRHMILSPVRSYFRYFPVPSGKRFLWRNVACHVRWLEYWTTATTLFGSKLHVDPRDDVGRCIYYFGVWEPNLTAWITRALSPGDTFVDVGAHVGYFSTLAAGIVKEQGSVVSIEGMPRTCDLLRANYQLNGIRNGRIVPMAVWDAVGNIEMFGPSTGIFATASAIKSRAEQWDLKSEVTVPCAPLSSILTAAEIKAARIVKIDVEGAEWRVVSGMDELMKSGRNDLEIVLEVNPNSLNLEGQSCQDLYAIFRKFGFHPYQIENLYGDLSRISLRPPSRPRRIEQIPEGEQSDVIFSRRDVDFL
jgi:FkbM family methyltransferase